MVWGSVKIGFGDEQRQLFGVWEAERLKLAVLGVLPLQSQWLGILQVDLGAQRS